MTIDNMIKAESFVKSTPNFYWEGWNLIYLLETPEGYQDKKGAFVNNKWHIKQVFKLEQDGWIIPSSMIKGRNV